MNCKNENSLTINLNLTDDAQVSNLQAYVFSSGGKPLGSSPISADNAAVVNMPDNMDGRTIEVLLGPVTEKNEPTPEVSALKRAGAYALPGHYLIDKPVFDFEIPGVLLPLWCTCNVIGRTIKRVTLEDGSVEEMPVCNARVHICEVDPWHLVLPRIPDFDIEKLRDDLLEKINPVLPTFPVPDPGPFRENPPVIKPQVMSYRQPVSESRSQMFSTRPRIEVSEQLAINALANEKNVGEIRKQLLQLEYLLYPVWCFFPYIWPYYHTDCVRTVDVDSSGYFNATIPYQCDDQADLYFWVEQFQDGEWTQVYRPSVACNTYWNYECGSEIVLNIPDADACEAPAYDIPDDAGLFVMPYKIGYKNIWGTPSGAPSAPDGWLRSDGLINYGVNRLGMLYDAPFGGTLTFHHDDSYFIPKGDSVAGEGDNSIKYYRYSYRRIGDTGEWTPMTNPQFRNYRVEYKYNEDLGIRPMPTFERYPVLPNRVGDEANLFEFRSRDAPIPDGIDPATVEISRWTTGNLDNIAASWNTNIVAPAMSESSLTDKAGTFEVKIEVFNESGQQVMPGRTTFNFLALNSDRRSTRYAEAGEVIHGAFVFKVHIDNNNVTSALPQPSIGAVQASDDCGFLRYEHGTDRVHVEFTATHPNDRAVFEFTIKRGSNELTSASTDGAYIETSSPSAAPYTDVDGVYQHHFAATDLVGSCINAAFAADLYVWGKAMNGRHRLGLDSRRLIAFALAESIEEEHS